MSQLSQKATINFPSWDEQIMRYVFFILSLIWGPSAIAQTQTKLQQQLLNMARQNQQIHVSNSNNKSAQLKSMAAEIIKLHSQALKQMVQLYGWPTQQQVGEKGVRSAFILLRDSEDLAFQQEMLPMIIQSYVDKQGIAGQDVAQFIDKVSVKLGKKQVFGTQAEFINGEVVFAPIENIDSVDQLRAQMELPSLTEYKKSLQTSRSQQK